MSIEKGTYYLTTAIDYVNGRPHMGHAMEKVGADVVARWRRAQGLDVWLVLGSDEHSISVAREARAQGKTPEQYCEEMDDVWREFWGRYRITFSEYVRSSTGANRATTGEFMQRLYDGGYIYKGKYEGWYCTSCEQFYPEEELLPSGNCPEHPTQKPQWVAEDNYYFRASAFEAEVRRLLEDESFLQPAERRREMLQAIKDGLRDVSISRTFTDWGFPLPFDETQVIYVWFDALLCYVTGAGFSSDRRRYERLWPADVHVIGKGITRFHTLMWPAMLLAAGEPLPKRVYSHGYITMGGEKMSKSRGLFFDPARLVDIFGSDGARFLLLREFPFDRDADFNLEALVDRFNADLANNLGNLASRTLTMVDRYLGGEVPEPAPPPAALERRLAALPDSLEQKIDGFRFDEALAEIWELVDATNQHIAASEPWRLAKREASEAELREVLYACLEVLRILGVALAPFIPGAGAELSSRLGVAGAAGGLEWGGLTAGTRTLGPGQPLFPRLDKEAVLARA